MRKAIDFYHGDVVIAQQLDHPLDETGYEQRHIATRYVGYVDGIWEGFQSGAQSFQRPPLLAFIVGDDNFIRQLRQRLPLSGNYYDWRNDSA
jgi:hypothetical protein